MTLISFIMVFLIITTLMTLPLILTMKYFQHNKSSPFECGFDPKNSARMPFSLNFFMIAVIFLIFDVEITLLLPFPLTMFTYNMKFMFMIMLTFIIILLLGTYLEWLKGALTWVI